MIAARTKILAAAGACAAFAVTGCGSSSAPSGGDPASVVPASSPLYAAAIVRPGGSLKSSLDGFAQKLLHVSDVGAEVQKLIAPSLQRQGLDYKRDIQPWLGSRVGVFLESLANLKNPVGAVVLSATDTGKARLALSRARNPSGSPHSYRGVAYTVSGTTARGIVGSYVVIGSEAGLHAVVDVNDGAASIASSTVYRSAISGVAGKSSIATVYAQPRTLLSSAAHAARSQPGSRNTAALLKRLLGIVHSNLIVGSVNVDPKVISLHVASTGSHTSTAGGGSADTLAALPGDTWLGLGAGDVGSALKNVLDAFGPIASSTRVPRLSGVLSPTSLIGLGRNVASWAGDTGAFIRGTGLTNIGVALAIQSKNPAASRAAVPRVGALLKQLIGKGATSRPLSLPGVNAGVAITPARVPLVIDVASANGGKFVIGLGDASVDQALHPLGRFGDSAAYRTAAGVLGGSVRPVFVLDFGGATTFLTALAFASPSIEKILPYVRELETFAVGVGHSGDQTLVDVALALH